MVDDNKDPKIMTKLVINSNYDLESIKAGETCQVVGVKKDSTLFNDNMQIMRIDYKEDTATLLLEGITGNFGTEMEKFIS